MLCLPDLFHPKIPVCFANTLSANTNWQVLLLAFYRWGTRRDHREHWDTKQIVITKLIGLMSFQLNFEKGTYEKRRKEYSDHYFHLAWKILIYPWGFFFFLFNFGVILQSIHSSFWKTLILEFPESSVVFAKPVIFLFPTVRIPHFPSVILPH